MAASDDLPRTARRPLGRGRVVIIVVAAAILVLITSAQELSMAFTDYLWYGSVGFEVVWKNLLFTKVALAVVFTALFFLVLYINLVIADRLAPKFRPLSPEDELLSRYQAIIERRAGWVRVVVALVVAIVMGVGNSSLWEEWLLFQNGGDFGVTDATFNEDVGFYVFRLPFITGVLGWLFAALVIVFIVTAVAHYLNGGIRLQVATDRVTPQVKRHLSLLLAALAAVKLAGYWFDRFSLTFSRDGVVDGATYTPVNAQLNAIYLLMFAAAVGFLCFVVNIWRRGWVLPIIAVGLWALVAVIAAGVYPAIVQRVIVQPAESEKEGPYIANNINATRQSYGLDQVETNRFDFSPDLEATRKGAQANPSTVQNIRLLDPNVVQPSYEQLQRIYDYYRFNDLDVDRYPVTGTDGKRKPTAVVVGTRDLAIDSKVVTNSWENNRIAYTHGYGVALAAANGTTVSGSPDFIVRDVPVNVNTAKIDTSLSVPGIYFGENMAGYAITGAVGRNEIAYQDSNNKTVEERYDGAGGVPLDSLLKRIAFWRRFGDGDILVSQFINSESRIIYQRDVRERVQAAAPFLTWDRDPYPILANGRVVYMIDGYTVSPNYPNAESWDSALAAGLGEQPNDGKSAALANRSFNYVRNSVKATVDAYDGKIKIYVWDPNDPIINAYKAAFPGLFTDKNQMPTDLLGHVRYPEDLFRVQTSMWGRYHLSDAKEFYQRSGAWSVAAEPSGRVQANNANQPQQQQPANQQPLAQQPRAATADARITPFYQEMRLPRDPNDSFVLFRSFVPVSAEAATGSTSQKLTSFIVAKSDPDEYGRLVVYEFPSPPPVDGPTVVDSKITADTNISREITLLNQNGSELQFGNMLIIPFGDAENKEGNKGTMIYVRPLYVKASGRPVPELKKVIVTAGESGDSKIVMRDTLRQALDDLLGPTNVPTLEGAQDQPASGSTATTTPDTTTGTGSTTSTTAPPSSTTSTTPTGDVNQLVADANRLLTEANDALAVKNLALYQQKVDEATSKIKQAASLSASAASSTTTTAPAAAPST